MPSMRQSLWVYAVLAGGALALHQLRYLIGYGDGAGEALQAHGHGYLSVATPLVTILGAAGATQFLVALASAARTGHHRSRAASFGSIWLAAGGALLATYTVQELAEGMLVAGHPGLSAVLDGGLWALPLAALLALVVAVVLRAVQHAVEAAGRRARRRGGRPGLTTRTRELPAPDLRRSRVLGLNLASRAPPLTSV